MVGRSYKKLSSIAPIIASLVLLVAPEALALSSLPKVALAPSDNPTTPAKVELGKKLFFDPRLSLTGTVSCNSCHNVMSGGDDSLPSSVGIRGQVGKRSAPTVWNSAFLSALFWDGRAATLEEQAKGPLINPIEMGMPSHSLVVQRLRTIPGYIDSFKTLFADREPITIGNVAKAIAAFERTLITPESAFDRYINGDKKAIDPAAKRGLLLVEEVGCLSCHSGPNFSGPELPQGQGYFQKFPLFPGSEYEQRYRLVEDLGRFEATKVDADKNYWRVPTRRNVAVTAPYFHNGSVDTLEEAVRVMAKTQLNKELTNPQVGDIIAFLGSLTGKFPQISLPRLPETRGVTLIKEKVQL